MENNVKQILGKEILNISNIVYYVCLISIVNLIILFAIAIRISIVANEISNIDNVQSKIILKQSNNDSLYMIHMSKCSFISNDRITVGYDNYLKLKSNIKQ